jgi:hypothetical protein
MRRACDLYDLLGAEVTDDVFASPASVVLEPA